MFQDFRKSRFIEIVLTLNTLDYIVATIVKKAIMYAW